jgi:hypothetical protein
VDLPLSLRGAFGLRLLSSDISGIARSGGAHWIVGSLTPTLPDRPDRVAIGPMFTCLDATLKRLRNSADVRHEVEYLVLATENNRFPTNRDRPASTA